MIFKLFVKQFKRFWIYHSLPLALEFWKSNKGLSSYGLWKIFCCTQKIRKNVEVSNPEYGGRGSRSGWWKSNGLCLRVLGVHFLWWIHNLFEVLFLCPFLNKCINIFSITLDTNSRSQINFVCTVFTGIRALTRIRAHDAKCRWVHFFGYKLKVTITEQLLKVDNHQKIGSLWLVFHYVLWIQTQGLNWTFVCICISISLGTNSRLQSLNNCWKFCRSSRYRIVKWPLLLLIHTKIVKFLNFFVWDPF